MQHPQLAPSPSSARLPIATYITARDLGLEPDPTHNPTKFGSQLIKKISALAESQQLHQKADHQFRGGEQTEPDSNLSNKLQNNFGSSKTGNYSNGNKASQPRPPKPESVYQNVPRKSESEYQNVAPKSESVHQKEN